MIELTVESLCYGGDGIGRFDGQAVFVPGSLPGDRAVCRIVHRRKNYLRAEVVEFLQRGDGYRTPPCPWYGRCGGCSWQHLDEPSQAQWKARLLADQFRRGLKRDDIPAVEFHRASRVWNYRSRVQFKCHYGCDGRLSIGFYRCGSHFVEDIQQCRVADERFNDLLRQLHSWLPSFARPDRVPQIDASVGDSGSPHVVLHLLSGQTVPSDVLEGLRRQGWGVHVQRGKKHSLQTLVEAPAVVIHPLKHGLKLGTVPGGFHQIHLEQNRLLVDMVTSLAALQGGETVLDLFCGMGNLTLPLARYCGKIVGVEDFAPAIECARENAKANGLNNARFVAAPAGDFLAGWEGTAELVVLDPPRTGARACVAGLLRLRPRRILYVSCDPATQVRDLAPLLGNGYRLERLVGIDMFPQTWHIESLALLVRDGEG